MSLKTFDDVSMFNTDILNNMDELNDSEDNNYESDSSYASDLSVDNYEDLTKIKEDFYQKNDIIASHPEISTMTVIAKIGPRVNLKIIFENLPHAPCGSCLNEKCKTCAINNDEIISLRYKDCEPKGKPIKKVAKRKNSKTKKMFYNQITIDICPKAGRKISTKLFVDGKVQMAGCKNEEEAHQTVAILIKNLKQIADIEEESTIELPLKEEEYTELMKTKKKYKKNEWRAHLYEIKDRPMKASVLSKLKKYEIPLIVKAVENKNQMKAHGFKIAMINSDFKICSKDKETNIKNDILINREKLRQILQTEYNIYCAPYESSRYPGINAKYISSIDCMHDCNDNSDKKSLCSYNMKKKKIEYGCVTVSILAFQQGKIILTGAQSIKQLNDTYKFISDVYIKHYIEIKIDKVIEDVKVKKKKQQA